MIARRFVRILAVFGLLAALSETASAQSLGTACVSPAQCASGFCVDGVCCNSACGGGTPNDCQACAAAAGNSRAEGQCGPIGAGVVCRPANGVCDAAEVCNGSGTACPADRNVPNGTICRSAAGACDVAETCSAASKACPADALRPATFTCRAKAGTCDVAEKCTGTSTLCPADAFSPTTISCRAKAGPCDVADFCTGSGADCPADAMAAAGTVCRNTAGACDVAEQCTGSVATCPADAVASTSVLCRAATGVCDAPEFCDGAAKSCPANARLPATAVCRPAIGPCDIAENCTGSGANCPADKLRANGTTCTDGNACTSGDKCVAGACVPSSNLVCGAPDQCHVAGSCNPATGACSNPPRPDGTTCNDGNPVTLGDVCTSGTCAGIDRCSGVTCTASDQCHVAGTCIDHATGACSNPIAPVATACNDGNPNTAGDVCTGGICAGVDHCIGVTCSASDQCHVAGTCVDHATGACSNPPKPEGTACVGAGGAALICSAGQCTHTAAPVDAQAAASWIASEGGSPMTVLTDGRVLVWSSHIVYDVTTGTPTPTPLVWPADATVNGGGTFYGSTGTQIVVWATPADGDYIYSSGENKHAFRADGTHAWSWLDPGCCDFVQNAAYDRVRDQLLNSSTYNALAVLDAGTGDVLTQYQPIVPAYQPHYYSVAGDKVFIVGGDDDIVAQRSLVDGAVDWSASFAGMLASGSLLPGAVAGDGTIVVGSSGEQGRLLRLNADGTIHFTVQNGTTTAPVISETAIYVGSAIGTTYTLRSYGLEGDLRWSIPVAGPPTSLLVGDDGVVFASLGGGAGEVVGARESDGSLAVHFVNLEAGGELMLRGGTLLLKSPHHLYALPVGARDYSAYAPWPVRLHDNHRSSGRAELAPLACPAADACHLGTFDPQIHACTNLAAADATPCDDGNPNTVGDVCTGGTCAGVNRCAGVRCEARDQCHTPGSCDPGTGACSNPAAADGTSCSDDDLCTQWDVCIAGVCSGDNPITCVAQDECHTAGRCDPGTGACSGPAAADGTPCGDGDACTQTDSCQAGICMGANPVICAAADQCHVAGTCDMASGVCSNPPAVTGTHCNDGNACTTGDICLGGSCSGGAAVSCDDGNPCTLDSCSPGTGCAHPAGNGGAVCRPTAGLCDLAETCTGASADCPPDQLLPGPNVETVASGQAFPNGIAVDGTSLYWTNNNDGTIRKMALGGGVPVTLATGQASPWAIAVDGTNVYWTNLGDGTIRKVALGGGVPTTLASGQAGPSGIAVNGTGIYWTNNHGGTVMMSPPAGGQLILASGQAGPLGIAVNGTGIYWTNNNDGKVMRVAAFGAVPTLVASGPQGANSIALDGTSIYWTTDFPFGSGTIMKVALAGGAPTTLTSGQTDPNGIAVDGTSVYWTDDNRGNGRVKKMALGGGALTVMTGTVATPRGIAVDGTNVYWTAAGNGTIAKVATNGAVCRDSAGACDVAERCTGTSAACPDDAKLPAGQLCRQSHGDCDPVEVCDGATNDCRPDTLSPSTVVCRGAVGPCDAPETCTGTSPVCPPADLKLPAGTLCRPSFGPCDLSEVCDGVVKFCPLDVIVPDGGTCDDGNPNTVSDICSGSICGGIATGTVTVGGSPGDARLSPDGRRVYVANDNVIDVIDVATARLVDTIPTTLSGASDVRVSPDGTTLYVGYGYGFGSTEVTRIDVASHAETGHLAMPTTWGSVPLTLSRDGSKLYAGLYPYGPIQTIDVATFSTGATFNGLTYDAYLAVSPDGGHLWVGNLNADAVRIIDVATGAETSLSVPGGALAAPVTVFSPNGTLAYVRSGTSGGAWVSKIDVASLSILSSIPLSENAQGNIAIAPLGQRLVVTNYDTSSITVLDASTMSILGRTGFESPPFGVAAADRTVYLPISAAGTVMVLPLP